MSKTKNRKHRKHRKHRKYSKKQKRKAGTLQSFRDTKIALANLEQREIPRVVSNKIFREFAASRIQDRAKQKNLQRLTTLITTSYNFFYLTELQLASFVNSVNTTYEFNTRNIPDVLLQILSEVTDVLIRIRHILRFHNEPQFLQAEFREVGYFALRTFILNTIGDTRRIHSIIGNYRANSVADYNMAQLGVESQPALRNYTIRRTDAIVRPPRTTRALALTRRIRSI